MKIVEQKRYENQILARFADECEMYNSQCYENTTNSLKNEKIRENMIKKSKNIEKARFEYFDRLNE